MFMCILSLVDSVTTGEFTVQAMKVESKISDAFKDNLSLYIYGMY